MSGHGEGVKQAFKMLRRGGPAVAARDPVPAGGDFNLAEDVIFKGVTVLGINGRRMWRDLVPGQALLGARARWT